MALWGVSGLDVKNAGWNGAVGLAVGASCLGVAWGAKKLALLVYHYVNSSSYFKSAPTQKQIDAFATKAGYGSCIAGLGALAVASWYVSNSRFALITDASISKMLKLGAVQTAVGLIFDLIAKNTLPIPIFTAIGAGVALAGHYSKLALFSFGVAGALLGSGVIPRHPK
jgi:hypothetical protein